VGDKQDRFPWDKEPYVDPVKATERAIRAAQPRRVDPKNAAVKAWADKAFNDEIELVKNASDRNDQLFKSSANLFEIVAAGALSEYDVIASLRDACDHNGLAHDDGEHGVEATIKSGRRHGYDSPRDLSQVGKRQGHNGFHLEDAPVKTVSLTDAFDLERGFWTSRESLQQIYLAALSRMCSPWSVLGYCAARALALVPASAVLPPIVGGRGSLNWFCALTSESGGGKSSSLDVATELVSSHVYTRNLGSGEGLVDSFFCKEDDDHLNGRRESVMFVADEMDGMTALGQRQGSTLMSTLRTAFSGGTLGFSYRGNRSHLESHSYRATLVIHVQPARAGALFGDRHGGTLQRFMWFPARDPRATAETPPFPGALTLPSPASGIFRYGGELQVPYETVELIRDERARANAGIESDPLGGHALYIREKFAYALAILDGRDKMTSDDWRLAGIASKVSDHTREWVEFEMRAIQDDDATERGRLQGVSMVAADEQRASHGAQRINTAAEWALRKIKEASQETDGVPQRDLSRVVSDKNRRYLQAALENLEQRHLIKSEEVKGARGPSGKVWRLVDDEPF
jgi:hypothetical protein